MAVIINDVYQKVLMFANKEQRGYITPQEFNMFADQAQKEIFEQYFYDLNQYSRSKDVAQEYSDIVKNINEKISVFESTATITNGVISAQDLYRLGTIYSGGVVVEEAQQDEIFYLNQSYLTKPTIKRPMYVRNSINTLTIYPSNRDANCTYVKKPNKPSWGYVVVDSRAMYNPSNTVNFQLHSSEESELVYKILKFAGLSMKRDDLAKGGQGLESLQVQQEKQ
tara:strand:- start:279 stop:950 length:672 start_codon:yes stop_codon:yes gene_type:complete